MAKAHDRADLEARLWREIDDIRIGMLGLVGLSRHMQPMTAFCEPGGPIWFFTRKDTEIARDARNGQPAMFCLANKDQSFVACLGGDMWDAYDQERIERFWNPVTAAWFPEGKDDPFLTLLRFEPVDAELWVSHGNPIRFAFDIAKANLTHSSPDVGERRHLDL